MVEIESDQVVIGRADENDICLSEDARVSRTHAVLRRYPRGWTIRDLGSANGTFVNGEPLVGERLLRARESVTIGDTALMVEFGNEAPGDETMAGDPRPDLTRRELDILNALCSPAFGIEPFTEPASVAQIAASLHVTEAAIKQHLLRMYDKFSLGPGAGRRVRLANEAIRRGIVRPTG